MRGRDTDETNRMQRKTRFPNAERQLFSHYGIRQPTTRLLRLSEPQLAVRSIEVGSGQPALFLHGITLCGSTWTPLLARLEALRCVAIDLPGHGGSDAHDFRGVNLRAWHAQLLHSCLDELELESAHLIGHSYGGMAALWMALDAPERVHSVISIGSPAVAFGARPDPTLRLLARPGIGPLALTLPSPPCVYRRLLASSLGRPAIDKASPELLRATYAGTRRHGFGRTVSRFLREEFRGIDSQPSRYALTDDELTRLTRPALVIWGELDDHYQPVDEGRQKAALMPAAQFAVVSGGHAPWLDNANAVADLITAFLRPGVCSLVGAD
jgi:pimeloyl-ACP methyl ester carboxylesterase